MLTKREYFDKLTTGAKLDYPDLVIQIDDIIEEMLSQCETENEPTDNDLWDAEKQLYDLIERTQYPPYEPTIPETWYEQNL
jgi:hypothetical protein